MEITAIELVEHMLNEQELQAYSDSELKKLMHWYQGWPGGHGHAKQAVAKIVQEFRRRGYHIDDVHRWSLGTKNA